MEDRKNENQIPEIKDEELEKVSGGEDYHMIMGSCPSCTRRIPIIPNDPSSMAMGDGEGICTTCRLKLYFRHGECYRTVLWVR